MSKIKTPIYLLVIISFLEGASLMITELLGSKLIAPYFGASLFVWSSVLSVTLIGLAIGYFVGGYLAEKASNKENTLLFQILLASILLTLMPYLSSLSLSIFGNSGVRWGSFFSSMIFLMPPILVFGSITPIIVNIITENINKPSGAIPGYIFAISTLGGVLFTLLVGFYFIPEFGIKKVVYITSILFVLPSIILSIYIKRYIFIIIAIVLILVNIKLSVAKAIKNSNNISILYKEESLLGQITVADINENGFKSRRLYINNIAQTFCNINRIPLSEWTYPHIIAAVSSIKPANSNVLLFGLGGGSLLFELDNLLRFNCDAVEIDSRMYDVAKKYFNYNAPNSKIYIDDARSYLNSKLGKKYDIIIFDILSGESQPNHVFTIEGFEKIKEKLNTEGLLIINYQGNSNLNSVKAIIKTLNFKNFKTSFYEKDDDFIVYARLENKLTSNDLMDIRYNKLMAEDSKFTPNKLLTSNEINIGNVKLLTDDLPILDYYNAEKIVKWRTSIINKHTMNLLNNGFELVK